MFRLYVSDMCQDSTIYCTFFIAEDNKKNIKSITIGVFCFLVVLFLNGHALKTTLEGRLGQYL